MALIFSLEIKMDFSQDQHGNTFPNALISACRSVLLLLFHLPLQSLNSSPNSRKDFLYWRMLKSHKILLTPTHCETRAQRSSWSIAKDFTRRRIKDNTYRERCVCYQYVLLNIKAYPTCDLCSSSHLRFSTFILGEAPFKYLFSKYFLK